MNASTAKTLGIILVVLLVLSMAWPLKYVLFAPAGLVHGLTNGWHGLWEDGRWVWPWVGLAGLAGLCIVAFWIAVVVWVYRDAEKRGMNPVIWALVVFFVHFVGLIVFLLIRSEHPVRRGEPAQPAPAAPATPAGPAPVGPVPAVPTQAAPPMCPKCGKVTDKAHTFCPDCGARIKPACPACGREVEAGWKACPGCGGSL